MLSPARRQPCVRANAFPSQWIADRHSYLTKVTFHKITSTSSLSSPSSSSSSGSLPVTIGILQCSMRGKKCGWNKGVKTRRASKICRDDFLLFVAWLALTARWQVVRPVLPCEPVVTPGGKNEEEEKKNAFFPCTPSVCEKEREKVGQRCSKSMTNIVTQRDTPVTFIIFISPDGIR